MSLALQCLSDYVMHLKYVPAAGFTLFHHLIVGNNAHRHVAMSQKP